MASIVFPQPKPQTPANEDKRSALARAFSPSQLEQMERDDYQIGASIFGILSVIFAIGLILTIIAVVAS